ncbi:putrescine-ornithine antiporter [Pseudomonas rhodesiae]|uniref:putrescine-ornithine antiporter n=1 Tax=Pseudomonas rhodesiae TaxID=76760 RepID=UPI000F4710FE|nr:putrescine-ornithine antiporter [Pseudomonas rhodesiae]ROM53734.1 putrescine-ornithine antiporter [Pseudomonas rhodesiae]ROM65261.1 putrescine-ornithine antiporter [Pseudomonas rhodesiae]
MTTPSKKMSLLGLTTLVTINMMGSGIIMLPASMAQLGAISLLSWLITAVGSMAIAYGFAQCGVFCRRAGGMSAYSEEAHGKSGFFLCSFLYFLSLIIANVAIAISAVGYLSAFIPWLASGPVPLFIGSLALIWLTTAANFGGPRLTGRIGVVTVWGVIIPVVGLCVIGWFYFKVEVFVAAWNPHQFQGWDAISASIPLTLWAFLGMESAAQGHDAVEDPQRTVPLACLLGTLGAALVYVLSTTVIQGIVPNAELASASAPFAVVYAQMFSPWVGEVIMALAVVACIGSLLGWQFTLAQTAKMSADQRMFPRFFSRITQANAPLLGLLACASLQSLIALSTISPTASAQFSKLVSLAVVTNLVPYVTALTGLMVMMHKARAPQALQVRNTLVVLVAAAYSLYAIYACGEEAVFGAMLVLAFGYVLYGFLAKRFVGAGRAESC